MLAAKDELFTRPSGGYTIGKSVRLRSSASAYLNKTYASSGNTQKWTWSGWIKLGDVTTQSVGFNLLSCGNSTSNYDRIEFYNQQLQYQLVKGGGGIISADVGSMLMRDPSAWYHIVVAIDTTQATLANRAIIYVNGIQRSTVNYATLNATTLINSNSYASYIGKQAYSSEYYDGYITEVNFIDGQQLTPSSFGSTNATTGVWQPAKYTGTYGTNGFYLNFSSNGTSAALGTDFSGNSNTWTVNNISVTAGTTYDSMTDVPTLTSATVANYAVFNPLAKGSIVTISDGNLKYSSNGASGTNGFVSFYITNGMKSYFEFTCGSAALYRNVSVGGMYYAGDSGLIAGGTGGTGTFATWTTNDVIAFACDFTAGTVACYKNNTLQTTVTGVTNTSDWAINAGQAIGLGEYYFNAGQQGFKYTPPTGYVALNTYNLPTSTITNGAAYMAATLYTGNSSTQTITNTVGSTSFKPDFVWIKNRTTASQHVLTDSVRGVTKQLFSSNTNAEQTSATGITSLNSNGFSLDTNVSPTGSTNSSPDSYVAWNWNTNGGSTSSNTNGSITSTVSAGATQGFSVVTYTGTGVNNATVGHGLGVTPAMIIVKDRTNAYNWDIYHQSLGISATLIFTTAATRNVSAFGTNAPTSTVFSVQNSYTNSSSATFVAYCFSAVAGYSAFGSYTGNGSTDGPFIYTGFRPRFILTKDSSAVGNWFIQDTSRGTYNAVGNSGSPDSPLAPNTSGSETDWNGTFSMDILSNGFKLRNTAASMNTNGDTYIYAAFAENPFKNALAR
jgi:hypothetical protein